MPCTTPRCCAHSPTASTLGCEVRQRVVDDDPALDVAGRRRGRASICGRMPTEMTTRSAGEELAAGAAGTPVGPVISSRVALEQHRRRRAPPSRARAARPRRASSWRSIRRSMRCTTVVVAAERGEPVRGLEPEQAAADHDRARPSRAASTIAAQSSGPRKTWRVLRRPGSAGRARREPVHRT